MRNAIYFWYPYVPTEKITWSPRPSIAFLSNPSSFQMYQKYPRAFRVIIFMIIHFFISLEQILWEPKKDDVPKSTSGLELRERTTHGIGINWTLDTLSLRRALHRNRILYCLNIQPEEIRWAGPQILTYETLAAEARNNTPGPKRRKQDSAEASTTGWNIWMLIPNSDIMSNSKNVLT